MQVDDEEGGEAWADILARRSPEGRAVVDELHRAEKAVLAIQDRITKAVKENREFAADFEALEAAMTEVRRMRLEVYRMARQ